MLKKLWPYTRGYRRWICAGVICSASEAIFELLIPLVMADIDSLCNDRRIQQLRDLLLRRSQRCFRHLRRHRGHDQPEQQNQSKEKRDPILFHPCILSFRQSGASGSGLLVQSTIAEQK